MRRNGDALTWGENEFTSQLGEIALLANQSRTLKRSLGFVRQRSGCVFLFIYPDALHCSSEEARCQIRALLLPFRSPSKRFYGHAKGVIQLSRGISKNGAGEIRQLYRAVELISTSVYLRTYVPEYLEMGSHCPQPMTTILTLDVSKTLCGTSASWLT